MSKHFVALGATFAVCAALAGAACSQSAPSAQDKAFGDKVRAYLLANPEILREMSEKLREKEAAELVGKAKAALAQNRQALERDARDYVANPNGRLTVTQFYDYQCGFCKISAPAVYEMIRENPDVRFVFKEFTIFGPVSEYAAKAALVNKDSGKYGDLHLAFMKEKPLTEAAVDKILTANGLDPAATKARIKAQDAALDRHLHETVVLAQTLGLEGTPAYVIGDTLIPGADMAALKGAIAAAKKS